MKLELNVVRMANEDVIATSVLCQHINAGVLGGHIYVDTYNAGEGHYASYTYNNDTGKLVCNGVTNGTIYFTNVDSTGWYYWDGAHYVKCDDQSDEAHPK